MKKKTKRGQSSSSSWREIRQTASRKVITAHARRRIWRGILRGCVAVATVVAMAAGTYWGVSYWQSGLDRMNTALPPQPLREIVFSTDGVLSQSWAETILNLPEEPDIMSIDIHRKKLRLESRGQVRSAVIRRLSDRLVINIEERAPVVRLATRGEDGGVVEYLVDREGYIYEGSGYDRHELSTLPFLGGISLQRTNGGFRRLAGIDLVDDLLRTARDEMPHLYQSWRVVNCGDLPRISIRSDEFKEIVFGPDRYMEQLRMLDMVVASNRRQMQGMQDRVDLSLGNQVVVR